MKNVIVLKQTNYLKYLYTIIRNKNTKMKDFIYYSKNIIEILMHEIFEIIPMKNKNITTSTNSKFKGLNLDEKICGVSILRSGDSMEESFRSIFPKANFGKILIQRDEATAKPYFYYSKLPKDLKKCFVILLDPMIGTGGSAFTAIDLLIKKGVKEDKIIFVNLVSCKEGLKKIIKNFKKVKIITGVIDPILNSKFYLIPGLGDFGDRYYGTK
jgi:uracil phosphoribosyltransferase